MFCWREKRTLRFAPCDVGGLPPPSHRPPPSWQLPSCFRPVAWLRIKHLTMFRKTIFWHIETPYSSVSMEICVSDFSVCCPAETWLRTGMTMVVKKCVGNGRWNRHELDGPASIPQPCDAFEVWIRNGCSKRGSSGAPPTGQKSETNCLSNSTTRKREQEIWGGSGLWTMTSRTVCSFWAEFATFGHGERPTVNCSFFIILGRKLHHRMLPIHHRFFLK